MFKLIESNLLRDSRNMTILRATNLTSLAWKWVNCKYLRLGKYTEEQLYKM